MEGTLAKSRARSGGLPRGALRLCGVAVAPVSPAPRRAPPTIVFYGFSILADACSDGIFPAFQQKWAAEGRGRVEFVELVRRLGHGHEPAHHGRSGAGRASLARERRRPARRRRRHCARDSWKRLPHAGVVNLTPFVILVRPGNPLGIRDFEDLARRGRTRRASRSDDLGRRQLGDRRRVRRGLSRLARAAPPRERRSSPGSGRTSSPRPHRRAAARTQFENGFGDALVTYEQEAIDDRGRGRLEADVVYPPRTILSEHTLVVVDRNMPSARAARSSTASSDSSGATRRSACSCGTDSAACGPSSTPPTRDSGRIDDPFRIADFGGWRRARREIVDGDLEGSRHEGAERLDERRRAGAAARGRRPRSGSSCSCCCRSS